MKTDNMKIRIMHDRIEEITTTSGLDLEALYMHPLFRTVDTGRRCIEEAMDFYFSRGSKNSWEEDKIGILIGLASLVEVRKGEAGGYVEVE